MEVQQTLNGARGGGGLGEGRYPGGLGGAARVMQAAGGWRPGVGGIVQRPYSKDRGFCVFWDYLTGLPKRSGSKVIGKVRRLLRGFSAWLSQAQLTLPCAVMGRHDRTRTAVRKGDDLLRTVSCREPLFQRYFLLCVDLNLQRSAVCLLPDGCYI